MSSRTSNLRAKIAFLLASLAALWAFAAFVTMREGLNLFWITTLDQQVGRPADALVATLQAERRLSAVVLAGGRDGPRAELNVARSRTDEAADRFRRSVRGTRAQWAAIPSGLVANQWASAGLAGSDSGEHRLVGSQPSRAQVTLLPRRAAVTVEPAGLDASPVPAQRAAGQGTASTPSGLPWRPRPVGPVTPLSYEGDVSSTDELGAGREASQVRRLIESYQSGARRGRAEAEQQSAGWAQPPPLNTSQSGDELESH